MRKLKDFFYDKNDIIIVLIILAVAAFIIYTRIGAIMDYPEVLAEKTAATATVEEPSTADEATEESSTTDATAEPASDQNSDTSSAKTVSITITDSDTSITVATKLYKAELVTSDVEFQNYISTSGKENSLKSGTFQIPKGSTNKEILNIIAN